MEASASKGSSPVRRGDHASPPRLERKTVEKNRRDLMKSLFTQLDALLPHSKQGVAGLAERLDDTASYIRKLKWRLARLKERRDSMVRTTPAPAPPARMASSDVAGAAAEAPALPHLEVREVLQGSALEVALVSGRGDRLVFYDMVRALEEEGAEVVNAGFAVVDDRVFHSVHSLVSEPRTGHQLLHVQGRLKSLVHERGGAAA